MNCVLLFFFMISICLIAYKTFKQHFLSPTFLSSGMFAMFAIEYYLAEFLIGKDISLDLVLIVAAFEFVILLGELLADYTSLGVDVRNIKLNINDMVSISIPKYQTLLAFLFALIIAAFRLYVLYSYYGSSDITTIIAVSRYDVARGNLSFGPILAMGYYICQVFCYVYIMCFMQYFYVNRKIKWSYLLPVVGFCLCAISTTSRSEFIKVACAFLTAYYVIKLQKNEYTFNFAKIALWFLAFASFFIWYGGAVRDIDYRGEFSFAIMSFVSYTCASLYGLDLFLSHPWPVNDYYGMYTLSNIYNLFFEGDPLDYEPMYFMQYMASNIYTALNKPLQDYGVGGMLLYWFVLSFIAVKIQKKCIRIDLTKKMYYLLYIFICHNVYIFLMAPIGDKAFLFYLNPKYLMEIIVSFIIVSRLFMNINWVTKDGEKISVSKR